MILSCIQNLILYMVVFQQQFIIHAEAVTFSFIPSPNVTVYRSAVYNCSVDDVAVSISWQVNGTSSTSNEITSLGIITHGAATQTSSLILPSNHSQINITTVSCIASGIIDGVPYINTSSSTLYVQGEPRRPDMDCYLTTFFTFNCNWSAPFVITGFRIENFEVQVLKADQTIQTVVNNRSELEYSYNAEAYGMYEIEVIPIVDSSLKGEASNRSLEVEEGSITNYTHQLTLQDDKWLLELDITDHEYVKANPSGISACFLESENGCYPEIIGNIAEANNSVVKGRFLLDLDDNRKWNFNVSLNYSSGPKVYINNTIRMSTFDVQDVTYSLEEENAANEVCFTITFINGSNSTGCFVEYTNENHKVLGNHTIERQDDEQVVLHDCVQPASLTQEPLSLSRIRFAIVYDIESDGAVNKSEPAFELVIVSNDYFETSTITTSQGTPSTTSTSSVLDHSSTYENTTVRPSVSPTRETEIPESSIIVFITCVIVAVIVLIAILMLIASMIIVSHFNKTIQKKTDVVSTPL